MKYPVLQVALDFVDLPRALKAAGEAVAGGADWVEAGTPLIKSEGLDAVRELRKTFPGKTIVADMKTMDAGRAEVEAAAKAGADIICVLAAASDSTIKECVDAGRNYGAKIEADLIAVDNPLSRAKQAESLGVDIIGVHCAIDDQMHAREQFSELRKICQAVRIPVSIAGGIHPGNAAMGISAGASIIVAGGAITKSIDPAKSAKLMKTAMKTGKRIEQALFKRGGTAEIGKILSKVSVCNISDAMHRSGDIHGLTQVVVESRFAGTAVTVRTYPGDWAKTVQAIDIAGPGSVIVIDAGGVGPAVWGGLATQGAVKRKIAGVIIDGAARDTAEIRKMGFPVYSRMVMPRAGEPKGFGEINIPVSICGVQVMPGDWIAADEDGICVVPAARAVEIANRAMHIMEYEMRLKKEISEGGTLGEITRLLKWEKPK